MLPHHTAPHSTTPHFCPSPLWGGVGVSHVAIQFPMYEYIKQQMACRGTCSFVPTPASLTLHLSLHSLSTCFSLSPPFPPSLPPSLPTSPPSIPISPPSIPISPPSIPISPPSISISPPSIPISPPSIPISPPSIPISPPSIPISPPSSPSFIPPSHPIPTEGFTRDTLTPPQQQQRCHSHSLWHFRFRRLTPPPSLPPLVYSCPNRRINHRHSHGPPASSCLCHF
ncbi:unnamed protein product [Closterium sp. NIES-54]